MASGGAPQDAALKIVGEADDEAARTYIFRGEDHTLGNALRHVLNRHPQTHLAGYTVPHPSEQSVNLRVQTKGAKSSREVLAEACGQLEEMCDVVAKKFEGAMEEHKSAMHE